MAVYRCVRDGSDLIHIPGPCRATGCRAGICDRNAGAGNRNPAGRADAGNAGDSGSTGKRRNRNTPETSAEEESDIGEEEGETEDTETEQDEDETEEAEPEETDTSQEDIYTAPEDKNHVNVSFQFTNASGTKPVYPVNLILKEVDTGIKEKITIRSSGQIVELEHGDYQVASIKDGGSMPLVASGQTMSIYKNARYTIQFQQNRARKMFSDFLKDNILLIVIFLGAAALYNATIIKNFNKHPRR